MTSFAKKKCTPCEGGVAPIEGDELKALLSDLVEWKAVNEHHIEKEFTFKDFKEALAFTNQIGALAEKENHHPDIHLSWGRVRIILWTHSINGLSENDFILAAKIDKLTENTK
jgi:4a-hydroxytetrahydrobiopterin dehydratase